MTKQDIREYSTQLGLPTAEKPQMACLSSRIPYGEPVTPEKLHMIEEAEAVLRHLGFHDVRVRHHELRHEPGALGSSPPPARKHLARIELGPEEISRLFENERHQRVVSVLRELGYAHVTLDLLGYRRGSLNDALTVKPRAQSE